MAHGNQYIELLMFWVIGLITGLLAGELRRKREEAHAAYRKLAESFERTKEAERLAAMGQLSAALAHEIRNPLASIKGSLPILLEGLDAGDRRQEFGAIVRKELQRLDDLTAEFLAYARPPRPTWVEEDLNAVVLGVVQLVGKEAERSGITVETDLDPELPRIWMDSDRIRQVLLNLALNAIEAMPGGGRVEIRTSPLPDSVLLTIQDSGPGIPEDLRDHIFEPFVTSKASGTGLGLAVVHNWVTRHGGTIELGADPATGACFRIWFPHRTDAPVDPSTSSGEVTD
jgi:signal transduction histidine kinase